MYSTRRYLVMYSKRRYLATEFYATSSFQKIIFSSTVLKRVNIFNSGSSNKTICFWKDITIPAYEEQYRYLHAVGARSEFF